MAKTNKTKLIMPILLLAIISLGIASEASQPCTVCLFNFGSNIIDGNGSFYDTNPSSYLNRTSGFHYWFSEASVYTQDDDGMVKYGTGGNSADINAYRKDGSSEAHIYIDKGGDIELEVATNNNTIRSTLDLNPDNLNITTTDIKINGDIGITGCYNVLRVATPDPITDRFCYTNGILTSYIEDY